jgi:hypothetical protein
VLHVAVGSGRCFYLWCCRGRQCIEAQVVENAAIETFGIEGGKWGRVRDGVTVARKLFVEGSRAGQPIAVMVSVYVEDDAAGNDVGFER